jgi:predicted DNA-binding transcriptional regulator YafY
MRASRLLSIMITLQLRGRVAASELARQFEVSKRTIYRDVEELSAAGVPIVAEHGANGGFSLLHGWQTKLTGMTAREAESLVFASLPGAAGELGFGAEAAAARLKFFASLPAASKDAARHVAERFHLDATPWHRQPTRQMPQLKPLAQAVWEERRIAIHYESWQAASLRTVEPLGIVLKAGEWYFLAKGRTRISIYKLANVARIEVLAEKFKRPARFELIETWQACVAQFEKSLRHASATLRVKPSALSRLDRLGADMSQPILASTPDKHGVREAVVSIEAVAHAAGLLLGFADEIEVLEPKELRQELARRARNVALLYGL